MYTNEVMWGDRREVYKRTVLRVETGKKEDGSIEISRVPSKKDFGGPIRRAAPIVDTVSTIDDNPFYPEAPNDWEKYTLRALEKPVINWELFPQDRVMSVTRSELDGLKLYQQEQDALLHSSDSRLPESLPKYPMKDPRRNPERWAGSEYRKGVSRLLFSMYAIEAYVEVFINGNSKEKENGGVRFYGTDKQNRHRRSDTYINHPFRAVKSQNLYLCLANGKHLRSIPAPQVVRIP